MQRWKNKDLEVLTCLYPQHGAKYCAELLRRSEDSVAWKAHSLGLCVTKRRRSAAHSQFRPKLTKVAAINFVNFRDEKVVYLLGLLWADGHLNNKSQKYRIAIEAVSSDLDETDYIFASTGEWGKYVRNRKNRKSQTLRVTSNKELFEFLASHNYLKKATAPCTIVGSMPINFVRFFVLGLLDGDGCWYFNDNNYLAQCVFTGAFNTDWSWLKKILEGMHVTYSIKSKFTKKQKYSQLIVAKHSHVKRLGEFLYSDHNIGFLRKRKKFNDWVYRPVNKPIIVEITK